MNVPANPGPQSAADLLVLGVESNTDRTPVQQFQKVAGIVGDGDERPAIQPRAGFATCASEAWVTKDGGMNGMKMAPNRQHGTVPINKFSII